MYFGFYCHDLFSFFFPFQEEEEEEKPTLHLLKPLMQMQAVYSSIVGAVHIVRTSLVTYFVSDDSSIVAVESEPEIMLEILPEGADGDSPMQGLQAEPRQCEFLFLFVVVLDVV